MSPFSSLRGRLLVLVALGVIPVVGLLVYATLQERRDAESNIRDETTSLTRLATSQQEQVVQGAHQLLIALAEDARAYGATGCNAHFADTLANLPQYANLGVADASGDIFCSGLPLSAPVNAADRTWFQRALQTGDFAVGDYQIGRITGKQSVNFGYPIQDENGQIQGVVFAALDLVWLNELVSQTELPVGANFLLIDSSGVILARNPDPEGWVGRALPESEKVSTILNQREGVAEGPSVDGVTRIYAFEPVHTASETGLYVSIGIPKDKAFADANADFVRNIAGLGVVVLLVIGASWVGSELFILRQARAMVGASRCLADGDLSCRTGLSSSGRGELNELARAFDGMAASLEQREGDLHQALAELQMVNESLERRVEERTQNLTAANEALEAEAAERRRAESELDRFFAVSMDMLCIAGLDGYFKRVNPAWATTLGYTVDEMLARPFIDFVHPDDRDATNAIYATQTEQGKDVPEFENRYLSKDGSYRWLLWNCKTVLTENRIYAVIRDMTGRKHMEEALKESEERNRAIVDTAVDGVITIDDRGLVESFNSAAERMFGHAADKVLGQNVKMLMPAPYRDEHDGYLSRYQKTGEKRIIFIDREVEGQRKDGSTFPMELSVSKMELGMRELYVGMVRDITARKQAEEELVRRAAALAQSNAELEDFTYVVSHDLKEPLRVIEAFSSFLAEEYADKVEGEGQRYIEVLQGSARRMRDLIDDLLELSRLGSVKPIPTMLDMAALLREVHEEMDFSLSEKNAELRVASDAPSVECDRVRIKQVLENLICNAIKYNDKEKPVIEVGWREGDGFWTFFVQDNGPGIDEKYHEKIFGIFERLVHREEQDGTGIGLSICKKILDLHGGKIWVESKGGGSGSTFFFSLPRTVGQHKQVKERRNGRPVNVGSNPSRRG